MMPECVICGHQFLPFEAVHDKRFQQDIITGHQQVKLDPLVLWGKVHPNCREQWEEDQKRPHQIAEKIYPYAKRQYGSA